MATSARYERLKKIMEKEKLDVVVVVSPENTLYFAETYVQTQSSIRDRLVCTILPLEKEPFIIGCSIEQETIEAETWIQDRYFFTEFVENPILVLADVLKKMGFDHGKVGIELDYLQAHYYRDITAALPDVEFVHCAKVFSKVRMIKEPAEIELLEFAGKSTVKALEKALLEVHPGDTEFKLATKIKQYMLEDGADVITFMVMSTAENSFKAHKLPNDEILPDGDLMRLDYGASYSRGKMHCYNSDVARTVLIGNPNPKYVEAMKRFSEAYLYTYEHVRPGISARDLYNLCKEKCLSLGFDFNGPHIGHSLGIGLHEFPMLSPKEDFALEENMVFCIEPVLIAAGRKFHMEDLVQVTATGYKVLTQDVFHPTYLEIH